MSQVTSKFYSLSVKRLNVCTVRRSRSHARIASSPSDTNVVGPSQRQRSNIVTRQNPGQSRRRTGRGSAAPRGLKHGINPFLRYQHSFDTNIPTFSNIFPFFFGWHWKKWWLKCSLDTLLCSFNNLTFC